MLERLVTSGWHGAGPIWWLVPLVPVYILLSWLDRAWQRLRAQRLPVPVVVVGNLTVGGAGKTPLVIHLVERLRADGPQGRVSSRAAMAGAAARTVLDAACAAPEPGR